MGVVWVGVVWCGVVWVGVAWVDVVWVGVVWVGVVWCGVVWVGVVRVGDLRYQKMRICPQECPLQPATRVQGSGGCRVVEGAVQWRVPCSGGCRVQVSGVRSVEGSRQWARWWIMQGSMRMWSKWSVRSPLHNSPLASLCASILTRLHLHTPLHSHTFTLTRS